MVSGLCLEFMENTVTRNSRDCNLLIVELTAASDIEDWRMWDNSIGTCRWSTVYHFSGWLRSIANGMEHDIRAYGVLSEGSIISAAILRFTSKWGLKAGRKPWATAYNGIFPCDGDSTDATNLLFAKLRQEYHHMRVVLPPFCLPPVLPYYWEFTEARTPLLDLSDLDRLWNSFDRRARQRIRKATACGVSVEESTDFRTFYELYRLTYVRQGIRMPLEQSQIEITLGLAHQAGSIRLFLARTASQEPAAGIVVGADSRRAYFMLAASHPVHRKTDAMSLLWWTALQKYAQTVTEVDLVGYGVESIDRFKKSFSPRYEPVTDLRGYAPNLGGVAVRLFEEVGPRLRNLITWKERR